MQLLLFPYASKAVHVTDVCPIANVLPDDGSHVMVGLSPELSEATESSHSTRRVDIPGSVVVVWLPGQYCITGSSLST